MKPWKFVHSRQTRILAAVLLLAAVVPMSVWAASGASGGAAERGFLTIANGSDQNVDGYLAIAPDEYGQWASLTFTGGGDIYNPVGAAAPLEATFSSALFLFVPGASERIVLSENPSYTAIADDFSLTLSVTSPLAGSDTDMDGVDDTLLSSFNAATTGGGGGGTNLDFDLTQSIRTGEDPGVSAVEQTYVITNNGGSSIDIVLARVQDSDLVWDPGFDFANDNVGTGFNAAGGDRYVFQNEVGDPTTAITISSPEAESYFGGKMGVQPAMGPPPYGFGTSTEVFTAFGVPASWFNHIAGVGYDTDGGSGATPPGSVNPEDGYTGLGFSATLGAGESTTINVRTTYGQDSPLPPDGPPPPPPPPIVEVPTLDSVGLFVLTALIALAGGVFLRRRFMP